MLYLVTESEVCDNRINLANYEILYKKSHQLIVNSKATS